MGYVLQKLLINTERKEKAERLEELKEKNAEAKETDTEKEIYEVDDEDYDIEYIEFRASSVEDLIRQVSDWAYSNASNVLAPVETTVGQNIDFTVG